MTRIFTREWPLKLLALSLAVFIWLRVSGEGKFFMEVTAPLELRNLSPSLIFWDEPPTTVSVRVRAPMAVLERLKPGEVFAQKDMSGANVGSIYVPLLNDDVQVPSSVEIVSISPPSLRLDVQPRIRRPVPIIPEFRGQLPEGYEMRGLSWEPKEVEMEGPEAAMKEIVQASTEDIVLAGRTTPFSERVNVDPKSARVRLVDPRPVNVEIVVAEKTVERTIADVAVRLRSTDGTSLIDPERVAVTISGPFTAVNRISVQNLAAWVELTGPLASPGPYALSPVVEITPKELAGSISVLAVSPNEVNVKLVDGRPPREASAADTSPTGTSAPTEVARAAPTEGPEGNVRRNPRQRR